MLSNSTRCLLQFKKEIYGAIYYKFRHAFVSYRESLHSRLSAQSCRFVFINQRTFCLQFIALFYVCRQRLHRNHAMKKVLEVISHRLKSHRRCDRIRQVAPICTPLLTHQSSGPLENALLKWHLRPFSGFCVDHPCAQLSRTQSQTNTHRPSSYVRHNVCSNRPHLAQHCLMCRLLGRDVIIMHTFFHLIHSLAAASLTANNFIAW